MLDETSIMDENGLIWMKMVKMDEFLATKILFLGLNFAKNRLEVKNLLFGKISRVKETLTRIIVTCTNMHIAFKSEGQPFTRPSKKHVISMGVSMVPKESFNFGIS